MHYRSRESRVSDDVRERTRQQREVRTRNKSRGKFASRHVRVTRDSPSSLRMILDRSVPRDTHVEHIRRGYGTRRVLETTSDVRTRDGAHPSEASFSADETTTRRSTVPRVRANAPGKDAYQRRRARATPFYHRHHVVPHDGHDLCRTVWSRALPRRAENRSSRKPNFRCMSILGTGITLPRGIRWKSLWFACARDRSVESRFSNRRGISKRGAISATIGP